MAVALVGTVPSSFLAATAPTIAVTRTGIVAGNLIVVAVTVSDTTTITNVSDGTTTITTPDVAVDITANVQRLALYSFPNHTGGTFTFTATFAATDTFRGIAVIELSGAALTSPLEGTASATGTSAAPASGNVSPSPTLDGAYIVGFGNGSNALTVAGGFADLVNDAVTFSDLSGFAQSVKAAVGATWTMTSGTWGAIAASYKPATGGATPVNASHYSRMNSEWMEAA